MWAETSLGDCLRIEHGFAFKGEHFADSARYVVLTPGNFHEAGGFRARPGKDRFYAARFPDRYLLNKGDLIVAMTEQGEGLLGSAALIPQESTYLHNQRIGLVREYPRRADRRFLYYLFNTDSVRQQIRNSSSGAKVRHTSPERIYGVTVRLPSVSVQKKIAAILSAYDDLIENNRRRIALLEKMAEEIYREWFVRLRFPGHEKVKFEKGVPAGWFVQPLSSICSERRSRVRAKELSSALRYVGLEHLPVRSICLNEWSSADTVSSDKLKFVENDILFSKIRPYLHKVALATFTGVCSSDAIVLRAKEHHYVAFTLFTLSNDSFIELATAASKGTKMPRADWDFLERLEIKIPSRNLLSRFQTTFDEIWAQIVTVLKLNEALRNSRDALLPRLISGKLAVDDLDIRQPASMQLE